MAYRLTGLIVEKIPEKSGCLGAIGVEPEPEPDWDDSGLAEADVDD